MFSVLSTLFANGLSLTAVLEIAFTLLIAWIVASIPAYVAGKVVTRGRATFGAAMVATLLGPIIYFIVLVVTDFFLGSLIGPIGFFAGFVLAFLAWIWVYKAVFGTGWIGGLAIAVLAIIVFIIMLFVIGLIFTLAGGLLPVVTPHQV